MLDQCNVYIKDPTNTGNKNVTPYCSQIRQIFAYFSKVYGKIEEVIKEVARQLNAKCMPNDEEAKEMALKEFAKFNSRGVNELAGLLLVPRCSECLGMQMADEEL